MTAPTAPLLTPAQLHTLRHMLGINTPDDRVPRPYRNYACVNPGDPEYLELERLGMVEQYQARDSGSYHWYQCTDIGRAAAMRSHRDIRYSKASRRYSKWLSIHEAWEDVTFRDFLTKPEFAEARNGC